MKTIHVGRKTALVLMAALGGLYYYQKRGGKIGDLASRGFAFIQSLRGRIERVAPSVAAYIPQTGVNQVSAGAMSRSTTRKSTYQPSTSV